MLLIVIAIKLIDGGPIYFTHPRLGKNGKIFKIIKFRTMIVDADNYLNEQGESTIDRISTTGRFLRKTSLDEIPQLFNVLMGQMSFIGPRPTLVDHWRHYTEEQKGRFLMLPGISGWAQVCGRNEILWSQRIRFDLEYIENYSLWFDLKILLLTIKIVFLRKNISMDRNASVVDDLGDIKPFDEERKS